MMNKPIIGLTMGDAAGIGPEIIIKAAMNEDLYHTVRIIVIGDTDILFEARKAVRSNILLNPIHGVPEAGFKQGVLDVIDLVNLPGNSFEIGREDEKTGKLRESISSARWSLR